MLSYGSIEQRGMRDFLKKAESYLFEQYFQRVSFLFLLYIDHSHLNPLLIMIIDCLVFVADRQGFDLCIFPAQRWEW